MDAERTAGAETEVAASAPWISVIVPTLNEAEGIVATLVRSRGAGVREVIVVDGGSTDATRELAAPFADRVVLADPGRARQMNAGAALASGNVLLFLHGDTLLPRGFDAVVLDALKDERAVGGRFDLALRPGSPLLWLTATLLNLRSRWSRIATGDQAIFVRRSVFANLGGFASIPLMEDVEISRRLKREGRVVCLSQKVTTSSRRWLRDGVVRTIVLMWSLRFLYFCGVDPARLRRRYRDTR